MSITVHFIAANLGSDWDEEMTEVKIKAQTGQSLMQAALAGNVSGIAADCGGCMSCATCHVIVEPTWAKRFAPPTSDELAMLDMTATPREASSRLSCQLQLGPHHDGLCVRLPQTQY